VPDGTYLGSDHATTTGPVRYSVARHRRIATSPLTVSVPLCLPLAGGAGAFAPRLELLWEVLRYCNMGELVQLAATSKFNRTVVRDYIYLRKKMLAERFFDNAESFYGILSDCHAVISGSAALHLLLPATDTNWTLSDIDIHVPRCTLGKLEAWLGRKNFCISYLGDQDRSPYSYSEVHRVLAFANGLHTVNVIVSKMHAAFAPIFELHSTAAMNFVSADQVFCAYPQLTFSYLSMVNPAPIYCGTFGVVNMDALRKYAVQGFTHLPWSAYEGEVLETPYRTRSLTDRTTMFVDTTNVPSVRTSYREMLNRFGVMDVEWSLGGRLDRASDTFVYPRVKVIENRS